MGEPRLTEGNNNNGTMWFEELTGFKEESPEKVKSMLSIEGDAFISRANHQRFTFGELEISTLAQLKSKAPDKVQYTAEISVSEVVADVQQLHCDEQNAHAIFQAASQFNLLEMVGPSVTPEQGIDRYAHDHTQGPACAIACGAGTIYRNYFVKIGNQLGQTASQQIDCLDSIGQALNNEELNLWEMKNGYALANQNGLLTIDQKIAALKPQEREALKEKLKVGIQWNTEVTLSDTKHQVSQVYCSALPVAYCMPKSEHWEQFARIILEASYEATLYASLINLEKHQSKQVYLTLVGGGAFGNQESWILESLQKTLRAFKNTPLDVKVVSYGRSNKNLVQCIQSI